MFLLIPIIFIISSAIGIVAIIWRKKDYIEKLHILNTTGSGSDSSATINPEFSWLVLGTEFLPEIKGILERIKINEYKTMWLMDIEKLLRRTRLIFLKIHQPH